MGSTNHIHNLHLSLHDRTCSELFITSPFKMSTYYWALHWYIGGQTNPVSPNKWLISRHHATYKSWCQFLNASIPDQAVLEVWHVSQVLPWLSVMFYIKVSCIFNDKLCTGTGLNITPVLFLTGLSHSKLFWENLYDLNIRKDSLTWPPDVLFEAADLTGHEKVSKDSPTFYMKVWKMPGAFFKTS